jgi:hypothetical protein
MARQAVVVNLSIDSESTRMLGAHSHIAEVQLLLDTFADVQALPTPLITCPNFIPGSLAGCPAGRAPGPCLLSGQLIRLPYASLPSLQKVSASLSTKPQGSGLDSHHRCQCCFRLH